MTDPGRLKTRLVLEAPVETPDGQGGVTRDHAVAATVWASVVALRAHESVVAGGYGASVTHRIVVRANVAVTMRHRFRDGARVYEIAGIRDGIDRRFHECDAVLRVD